MGRERLVFDRSGRLKVVREPPLWMIRATIEIAKGTMSEAVVSLYPPKKKDRRGK